jgi:hypothetical protein
MEAEWPVDRLGNADPWSGRDVGELTPFRWPHDDRAAAHAGSIQPTVNPERLT